MHRMKCDCEKSEAMFTAIKCCSIIKLFIINVADFTARSSRTLRNFSVVDIATLCTRFCLRFNFSNRQYFLRHESDVNGPIMFIESG